MPSPVGPSSCRPRAAPRKPAPRCQIEDQFAAEGKADAFRVLRPWLTGEADSPQSAAAAALGLSETAVKVAIHRLRQRFRQQLRTELAMTLDSAAMVDQEMGHLFAALC